tara:strand:- start:574 stop:675 length:102 start_codon:yes stop_codon:yes gene_type:complete
MTHAPTALPEQVGEAAALAGAIPAAAVLFLFDV